MHYEKTNDKKGIRSLKKTLGGGVGLRGALLKCKVRHSEKKDEEAQVGEPLKKQRSRKAVPFRF